MESPYLPSQIIQQDVARVAAVFAVGEAVIDDAGVADVGAVGHLGDAGGAGVGELAEGGVGQAVDDPRRADVIAAGAVAVVAAVIAGGTAVAAGDPGEVAV